TPITPWNPCAGLSIAVILQFRWRMIPFLFIAPLLGDLVVLRRFPFPFSAEVVGAGLVGGGDGAARLLLARPKVRLVRAVCSTRDLFALTTMAVVSAAVVAAGYVGLAIASDVLPAAAFNAAALRYWVGDVIGIMVLAPFALILVTRRDMSRISGEV